MFAVRADTVVTRIQGSIIIHEARAYKRCHFLGRRIVGRKIKWWFRDLETVDRRGGRGIRWPGHSQPCTTIGKLLIRFCCHFAIGTIVLAHCRFRKSRGVTAVQCACPHISLRSGTMRDANSDRNSRLRRAARPTGPGRGDGREGRTLLSGKVKRLSKLSV